jgi:NAD-dependent DNA ligase
MIVEIEIPTNCPSCNSVLIQINSQLFCRSENCSAKSTKKVEAFVKKMRIKGLGPASISKLGFVHPLEIYETSLDTFVEVLGEKIGQKIFDEVENSKTTTFATFLSALSIPLIGDTASKKIARHVNALLPLWDSIEDIGCVGPKAIQNFYDWIESDQHIKSLELEKYFTFNQPTFTITATAVEPDSMGKVCITGKLKDFSNRAKAKEFLEEHGYTVTSTVSSKTDYLVCEDGSSSSKSKKAESLEIPIVTIENLTGKY